MLSAHIQFFNDQNPQGLFGAALNEFSSQFVHISGIALMEVQHLGPTSLACPGPFGWHPFLLSYQFLSVKLVEGALNHTVVAVKDH